MCRRLALLLCVIAIVAASCSRQTWIVSPVLPPEGADSPAEALRVMEWAWNHRNYEVLSRVLTEDFRFTFVSGDSAGNAFRDTPWSLLDELISSKNAFEQASDLHLEFDGTLIALADERPGKHPTWHKTIRTRVDLKATINGGGGPESFWIRGHAKFYLVRGDSASLSITQVALGGLDSTRWWIDRLDDETLPLLGTHANPMQNFSWGAFKRRFR